MQRSREAQWISCGNSELMCLACTRTFPADYALGRCSFDQTVLIRLTSTVPQFKWHECFDEVQYLSPPPGRSYVYRCRSREDNSLLVIKVPSGDPSRFPRFAKEAAMLKTLQHKNIVRFRQFSQLENGTPYYITDYLPGKTLQTKLEEGPLSVGSIQRIFTQICDALDYAHSQNAFHWDLKPKDIMVDENENAVVFDFGKGLPWVHSDNMIHQATNNGDVFGDPTYLPPEVANGKAIDARSNVYSLGAIMYACLESKLPFYGNNWAHISLQKLSGDTPTFSDSVCKQAPPALLEMIRQCMAVDPDARPQSTAAVREALS